MNHEISTSLSLLLDMNRPESREQAWAVFLQRYRPLLLAWCQRRQLSAATADDVIATVLLRLVRSLGTFQPEKRKGAGGFRAWLRAVVESVISNAYRERLTRPGAQGLGGESGQELLAQVPARDEDISSLAEQISASIADEDEKVGLVVEAVRHRVEEWVWRAFYETAVQGRTAGDVAADLGIPKGSVYVFKSRVLKMLRAEGERVGE